MSAPRVRTAAGDLRGLALDGVEAFLGIPYAAAPTGALRWAPPAPVEAWPGIREATGAGPVCPQPARPFSEWAHGPLPATDEDSLTLNLWRPQTAPDGGRPVLVFLHGGGWALGWGSNPLLDGRHLARALDAVVVTLNYRLGTLGWLCHPALAPRPGAPAGNWGLLDQLAALRWVAANAAAFGGDPARVTLAGESAGAGSALHLLADPAADGLFTRVIALSPPLHELVIDADLGTRFTAALVAGLGLGDDVAGALDALRARPAQAIVDAQEALLAAEFRGTRGGAMPIVEPGSLPADPARHPGVRPDIPLLIGSSAQEGTFFFRAGGRRVDPDPAELLAMVGRLTHLDPEPAAELLTHTRDRLRGERGPEPAANDVLCEVVTEAWFAGPVQRYAEARAQAGADVRRYRIEHPSPDDGLGALHSLSVPLLFGTWREGGVARRLAGDGPATEAVTAALSRDVRGFVHGEPLDFAGDEAVVYGGPGGPRALRSAVA